MREENVKNVPKWFLGTNCIHTQGLFCLEYFFQMALNQKYNDVKDQAFIIYF
jgi:hypothetical protein